MTFLQKQQIQVPTKRYVIAIALSLCSIASLCAQDAQSNPPAPTISMASDQIPAALRKPVLGIALNIHHISDLELYLRSVDQIAELGANALVVVTPWFQDTGSTNTIYRISSRCPTDEQLKAVFKRAKQRNLRTAIVPIVLIKNPVGKEWRGTIAPTNWEQWWMSYGAFINHFAGMAAELDIDILSIGSELNSTEDQEQHWTHVAAATRKIFSGTMTYTANWDRYEKVKFWNLVDAISISAYFELVENPEQQNVLMMSEAWGKIATKFADFAKTQGRPLLLMQVGYPSVPWAALHPWNYQPGDLKESDPETQARAYEAFLTIWTAKLTAQACPVQGFFLYHWDPYHSGGSRDFGYGIDGKPAKTLIRDAFQQIKSEIRKNQAKPQSLAD